MLEPPDFELHHIYRALEVIAKETDLIQSSLYRNSLSLSKRWIKENGLEQKLIVTYSLKYRDYHSKIRNSQIERALKVLNTNPSTIKKHRQNDYKRFIEKTTCTINGEVAVKEVYSLDTRLIER